MNELMSSMQTSSGLRLSLKWKNRRAESEEQMDTAALVELLSQRQGILCAGTRLTNYLRISDLKFRKRADRPVKVPVCSLFTVIMRDGT